MTNKEELLEAIAEFENSVANDIIDGIKTNGIAVPDIKISSEACYDVVKSEITDALDLLLIITDDVLNKVKELLANTEPIKLYPYEFFQAYDDAEIVVHDITSNINIRFCDFESMINCNDWNFGVDLESVEIDPEDIEITYNGKHIAHIYADYIQSNNKE